LQRSQLYVRTSAPFWIAGNELRYVSIIFDQIFLGQLLYFPGDYAIQISTKVL